MGGLGLPVFKLLQKTPSGKDDKREPFLRLLEQRRGRGGSITSIHLPPARRPAVFRVDRARGLAPSPPPTPLLPAGRLVYPLSEQEGF